MSLHHALLAPTLLVLAPALPGQESRPTSAVDRAIEQFGQEDPAAALDALRSFVRAGAASAPLLRRVLDRPDLPAPIRGLADRALALCEIDGAEAGGLRVGIRAEKDSVAVGETVKLTLTIGNFSERAVELPAGMSYSGNRFGNGLGWTVLGEDHEVAAESQFGMVGFCGTGAYALKVELAPWTYQRFELEAKLAVAGDGQLGRIQHTGPYLEMGLTRLPFPEEGIRQPRKKGEQPHVELRFGYVNAPAQPGAEPAERRAWTGELVSRTLRLSLEL